MGRAYIFFVVAPVVIIDVFAASATLTVVFPSMIVVVGRLHDVAMKYVKDLWS